MANAKKCPICEQYMEYYDERYPNTVCKPCMSRAVDLVGNKVEFFNAHMGGGLITRHTLPDGSTRDDVDIKCMIDDRSCHGVEFHMGGTGIILDTI